RKFTERLRRTASSCWERSICRRSCRSSVTGSRWHSCVGDVKRSPAYQGGDQTLFRTMYRELKIQRSPNAEENREIRNFRNVAHTRKTDRLFRFVFAPRFRRDRNRRIP